MKREIARVLRRVSEETRITTEVEEFRIIDLTAET